MKFSRIPLAVLLLTVTAVPDAAGQSAPRSASVVLEHSEGESILGGSREAVGSRLEQLGIEITPELEALLGGTHDASAEHEFTGLKVRFETADVDSTIHFYRDVLGLEIVDQWSDGGDAGVIFGLEDVAGTAFLEFGHVASPDNGAASVQFRVVDMAAFLARLGDRWAVDGPHERPWGSVYTYLTDPNGVQVIVYTGTV